MKVVLSKNLKKAPMEPPPIHLIKPEQKSYEKGKYMTLKLRSIPNDEHSPTHEIQVPYFKQGTCEEFLEFQEKVNAVIVGQNMTTAAARFAFMRTILQGDAHAYFNQVAQEEAEQTLESYDNCMESLTTHIFPQRALRKQKRYMRRHMRKPYDMPMRIYRNRVVELNNYLASFPGSFNAEQKLEEEEIIDILEFGIPKTWQDQMVLQGFDPTEDGRTSQDLVEFCERLEATEAKNEKPKAKETSSEGGGKQKGSTTKGYAKGNNNKKWKGKDDSFDPDKYCTLHGVVGHDLNNCEIMKKQAAKLRAEFEQQKSRGQSNDRPRFKGANNSPSIKELHATIQSMVAKAVKGSSKKRKRSNEVHFAEDESDNDSEEEHLNQFDGLNLKEGDSSDNESSTESDIYT
jgi:hypothetical protein